MKKILVVFAPGTCGHLVSGLLHLAETNDTVSVGADESMHVTPIRWLMLFRNNQLKDLAESIDKFNIFLVHPGSDEKFINSIIEYEKFCVIKINFKVENTDTLINLANYKNNKTLSFFSAYNRFSTEYQIYGKDPVVNDEFIEYVLAVRTDAFIKNLQRYHTLQFEYNYKIQFEDIWNNPNTVLETISKIVDAPVTDDMKQLLNSYQDINNALYDVYNNLF